MCFACLHLTIQTLNEYGFFLVYSLACLASRLDLFSSRVCECHHRRRQQVGIGWLRVNDWLRKMSINKFGLSKSGCVWQRTFYKNSSFINLQYTSYFTCFISSKSSLFCQWKASNLYENWLYFFVFWWLVIKSDFTSLSYNNNKSRCSLLKRSRIKKKKLTIACYRCQYFIPNPSRPHYEIRKKMSSPPHVWQSL